MALSTLKTRLCRLERRVMDTDTATTAALKSLNALHSTFMELLEETLDAAEDGVSPFEGVALSVHYVQASIAVLRALKLLPPEVRARLRTMAPQTRFVYDEEPPA
jgi:hypothetical protein